MADCLFLFLGMVTFNVPHLLSSSWGSLALASMVYVPSDVKVWFAESGIPGGYGPSHSTGGESSPHLM